MVAVALAVAVLGAPLGWLWAWLTPDVPVQVVPGGVVPTEEQPEEFFAADGWFILLGVAFGLLAAVAVWFLLRRHRGPVALVAVTVGAVGAGLLAWWVGHRIGLSGYRHQVRQAAAGTELDRPPELRAKELGWWFGFIPRVQGDLLIPAIAAAVAYTMLAAWSRYPSLGRGEVAAPPDGDTGPDQGAPAAGEQDQLELGGTASSDSGTGTART
jgi:Protein of unknown function (DUF2567)